MAQGQHRGVSWFLIESLRTDWMRPRMPRALPASEVAANAHARSRAQSETRKLPEPEHCAPAANGDPRANRVDPSQRP